MWSSKSKIITQCTNIQRRMQRYHQRPMKQKFGPHIWPIQVHSAAAWAIRIWIMIVVTITAAVNRMSIIMHWTDSQSQVHRDHFTSINLAANVIHGRPMPISHGLSYRYTLYLHRILQSRYCKLVLSANHQSYPSLHQNTGKFNDNERTNMDNDPIEWKFLSTPTDNDKTNEITNSNKVHSANNQSNEAVCIHISYSWIIRKLVQK